MHSVCSRPIEQQIHPEGMVDHSKIHIIQMELISMSPHLQSQPEEREREKKHFSAFYVIHGHSFAHQLVLQYNTWYSSFKFKLRTLNSWIYKIILHSYILKDLRHVISVLSLQGFKLVFSVRCLKSVMKNCFAHVKPNHLFNCCFDIVQRLQCGFLIFFSKINVNSCSCNSLNKIEEKDKK